MFAEKPSVKSFDRHQLRFNGYFQYQTEFRDLVAVTTPAALKIDPVQWAEYTARYEALDLTIQKISMSEYTERIRAADAARDEVLSGLVKYQKMSLEHYDPAKREAARKLDVVFHTYGNVAGKPINEETSTIYNFAQELKTGGNAVLAEVTGIMPWVTKLAQMNFAFENLIKERDRETADKTHIAVKTARAAIDEAYRCIVKSINATLHLKQLTGCEDFVNTMNAVIHRYKAMIHQQQGRHHGTGTTPPGGGGGGSGSGDFVTIGGKKWMKNNLNIATADSWCYGEGGDVIIGLDDNYRPILDTLSSSEVQANCDKYGRLYTWAAAKTACPSGWHLPTRAEWGALAVAAGGTGTYGDGGTAGKALKSTGGWYDERNGTDQYGFSALPGGDRITDGTFIYVGYGGYWWTATESDGSDAYLRNMSNSRDYVSESHNVKGLAFSVRCVGD
ncbi:hypothetical protein R80B4_02922 [Fibrobacteres bacterium R8-0-B4]